MVSHEDLNVKFATLEGQMHGLLDVVQRIEVSLQHLIVMDKNLGELALRQSHTAEALGHLRERQDEQKNQAAASANALTVRIEDATRISARFENRMTGALAVVATLLTFAATGAGWMLNRIDENSKLNVAQEQRISALERELMQLQQHKKITLLYRPPAADFY